MDPKLEDELLFIKFKDNILLKKRLLRVYIIGFVTFFLIPKKIKLKFLESYQLTSV